MSAGRTTNSQNHSWGTPHKYVDAIKDFFGGDIDLDPCSNEHSIVNAKTEFVLPNHDGLHEKWDYSTIYMNPPYGADRERGTTIKTWLAKCTLSHKEYEAEILALVPVATNTSHWKKNVFGEAKAICFLYDTRLKFLENGNGGGKGAPMACAIIYWGRDYERFYNIFIKYGAVVDISNLQDEEIGATSNQMKLVFG